MIEQRRNWLVLCGQVAALGCMALLGMADVAGGLFYGWARLGVLAEPVAPVQVLLPVAMTTLWLPARRLGPHGLPVLAMALFAGSLLLTGLLVVVRPDGRSTWGWAEAVGMVIGLLVVARRGRAAPAVPAATLGVLALAVQPARAVLGTTTVAFGLLQALLGVGAVAIGGYLRFQQAGRERQVALVQARQRAEFARDLHDFIAHHVTGIVVQAQGARVIAEHDPLRAAAALEQIERAGGEAMTAMRKMVAMLREQGGEAPTAPLAGVAELPALLHGFQAAGGPPTRLYVEGSLDGLPVHVATSAYRVVMEALTNVRQHATGAREVQVWLRRTPELLLLRVCDDGAGAPRRSVHREVGGFGLIGLTERLAAIGGRLSAGPGIERGWVLDATLPIDARLPVDATLPAVTGGGQ